MLSLANISSSSAATHYYEKDDYYAKDDAEHKSSSEWAGKSAEKLRLSGEVEKDDFRDILNGKLSNGEELGRKADGELVHAPGMDLTFSAPKSVSIAAEVHGDNRIYEAQRKAVLKTLEYIEKNLVQTRKMIDGKLVYEKADNITAALFRHGTSRNLDPQLHTHCVLANIVERADGEYRSAFFGKIFDNKLFLGQMYRAELACELKELGYDIRITGADSRFELQNTPDSLIRTFSTRSKDIANALEDFDNVSAKLKAEMTLRTRENKSEMGKELLQERWLEVVREHDMLHSKVPSSKFEEKTQATIDYLGTKWQAFCEKFDISRVYKTKHIEQDPNQSGSPETRAIQYATEHLSERQSVWEEKELVAVAMGYATGVSNFEKITAEVQKAKADGTLLISKPSSKALENLLTTQSVLTKELETIEYMRSGKGTVAPIYSKAEIDNYLQTTDLKPGQQDAVRLILTSKDRITGVQGYAGTGKTYMLQHAKLLANNAGLQIIGLAPSSSAATTLEKDSGIPSQTLHKFLFKYAGVIAGRGTEEGRVKMRSDLRNAIVVLDEASLASTGQMHALAKLSNILQFRVIPIGDLKQLDAVEAGKPFYQLQKSGMKIAIMGDLIRQKNTLLKSTVYDAINGDIKAAMSKLKDNIIEPSKSFENLIDRRICLANLAANQWLSLSNEKRKTTLLTAPSHIIREAINNEIRQRLRFEGELSGPSMILPTLSNKDLTYTQKMHSSNYETGDIVRFNRKYGSLGIDKDEQLSVKEVKNNIVILKNEKGKLMGWQPDKIGGNRKGAIEVFRSSKLEIQVGESLQWTRNSHDNAEVINSRMAKVLAIDSKNVTLESESGKIYGLKLTDPNLKHLDYAYAVTAHAAQGRTYDGVIGVIESSHKHLTNQKLFYVTISRARHTATLVTDDKAKLQETLLKSTGELVSAMEHQGVGYTEQKPVKASSQTKLEPYISHTTKDIYHAIYDKLPHILPEFGFRKHGSYYVSSTQSKIDGSAGKAGKVYVYANNPGVLVDFTRGNKSIWDYVQHNYMPASSKVEMMEYLSDVAGLSNSNKFSHILQSRPVATVLYAVETIEKKPTLDPKLLATIDAYAKDSLFKAENKVLSYLQKERGYDDAAIKSMGLGYIESKQDLGKHLRALGYSKEHIKEAYKTLHYIGKTHNLVIPYKDAMGSLIGFAGRNIGYKETDTIGKYLYTKGLSRSSSLLNIHNAVGAKEVVLVEGMLDSLHAQSKGLTNILALGGTAFNSKQLQLLQDSGVKSVVLCLDNDKAGKEASERIKGIVAESKLDIGLKQASLPAGIKDPDQMIREKGVDGLKVALSEARAVRLQNTAAQLEIRQYIIMKDIELEK